MKLTSENIGRILASVKKTKVFGSSKRQHHLLKYLLDETAAGRGETIKAYSIAVDVLGRDESFDNMVDSITRVEMHRLRKNLALFNMIQSEIIITLPKAQFIPVVESKCPQLPQAKEKPKKHSPRKAYRIILALVLPLCAALFTVMFYTKTNSVADVTFSARMLFPTLSSTSEIADQNIVNVRSITNEIKYRLVNSSLIDIKNHGPHDYKIEIEISNTDFHGNKSATVFIYEENGTLAWSNTYEFPEKGLNNTDISKRIAQYVFTDAFSINGKFTHYHATNIHISKTRRYLYQCFLDAGTYTITDATKYFYTNLLSCLDSRLTNIARDKNRIHTTRADVYIGVHYGALPYDVESPLKKAEAELKIAQKHEFNSRGYLHALLKVEVEKIPRNNKNIQMIFDNMHRLYPNNHDMDYLRAYILAEYYIDWPKVLPLADALLQESKGQFSHANLFYVYYYIHKNDWENASKRYDLIPENRSTTHIIYGAIISCNLSRFRPEDNFVQRLKNNKITSLQSLTDYIKKKRLHETLESQLLKPEILKNCPILNKGRI
ncbi:MAG: hypothetical protein COA43_10425 [Robiginitomaculum sp.]|nr:MAG: hypothetical protein COA43_10425 [Robiginitomaculum sp.]